MKISKTLPAVFSSAFICLTVTACQGGSGDSSGEAFQSSSSIIEGNIATQIAKAHTGNQSLYARLLSTIIPVESAVASVPGIKVTLRDIGTTTITDANGHFRLQGLFHDDVVLDFQDDNSYSSLGVVVPEGSRLVLRDIAINQVSGVATYASSEVLDFVDGNDSNDGNSQSGSVDTQEFEKTPAN